MKLNTIINADCIPTMKNMDSDSINLTLTDIPYGEVNRDSNGLRALDKENADIMTFDLEEFLTEVYRVDRKSTRLNSSH